MVNSCRVVKEKSTTEIEKGKDRIDEERVETVHDRKFVMQTADNNR